MNKDEIKELVKDCLTDYFELHEIGNEVTDNTALIGSDVVIDSMGLVNIIVDIESELLDKDYDVTLTSEKAMSRKISPFRSVNALVDFIYEQINE